VRTEKKDSVAVVWIDHPPVNVLSTEVLRSLVERLREIERDGQVRAVVLAGAGEKAFAAGASIHEMAPMKPPQARVHGSQGQFVTRTLERLPIPVIAAVHGVCVGGGCEIAMSCDFIIASDDALFGQPEINLGVMPGWGGTQRLPRRVNPTTARAWVYTGRSVPASEAYDAGLVYRVVPRPDLLNVAIAFARELSEKSPLALAAAKYAMNRAIDPDLDGGLAFELTLWERLFGTADQKEGMRAFLEKRSWIPTDRANWARDSREFPWSSKLALSRKSGYPRRRSRRGKPKS
jgi:enoyl-CoA hydratase